MIPNITRGDRFDGLMAYLVDTTDQSKIINPETGKPEREGMNAHTNPHLVAGDADLLRFYGGRILTPADAAAIAFEIDEARRVMGTEVSVVKRVPHEATGLLLKERAPAHVWHCSLSLAAAEGQLTDEQWNAIATDFVDAMGFTAGSGKAECRWVAVRHGVSTNGNDHVHLAVSLVRADGTKATTHNDFRRAQETCRNLEVKYGLAITGDRAAELGTRGVTPAARAAGEKRNPAELDAAKLARVVRAAAAAAADEGEFVRRVRQSGIIIRPRFAKGRDDVVEGYSVALRPAEGQPIIWHGGGKLARDLTLPRLRQDWEDSIDAAQAGIDEWRAAYRGERPVTPGREATEPDPELWTSYVDQLATIRAQFAAIPIEDTATWAIVARDTAGIVSAWSQATEAEPGPLAAVATELAKSAQIRAHQVRPRPAALPRPGGVALILATGKMKAGSSAGHRILLGELLKTSESMFDMMIARGDAARAQRMVDVVREQLLVVHARLPKRAPAPPVRTSVPESARVAIQELDRFTNGTVPRPAGVPPQTPTRAPMRPPANDPEIDR